MTAFFSGKESLRVRGERTAFVLTLASLPLSIFVLGWVFQHQIGRQEIALLLVVAMLYVAFARGRLLGGGLRVHAGQFSQVHAVVDECARMLRMPTPHVFVRDDPFVPVVAIGIGDPYAIVISAQYVEHFRDDELRFLIGRELGHIASGHTRYTSLMSSNGRENGILSVALGAWLRTIDYTADRVGLLCCGSLDAALRAIAVATFHTLGRKVDLHAFAEQLKELHAEPSLRLAEWTASTPYATNRIAALHRFARDPLYLAWAPRFAANAAAPPVTGAGGAVFAGFWRRAWAFAIDLVVIQLLVPAVQAVRTQINKEEVAAKLTQPGIHASVGFDRDQALLTLVLFVYAVVLVGLVGQTFGMMVSDLRVVAVNRPRVGVRHAIARYVLLTLSFMTVFGVFFVFRRVQPYEKWSRTRLVSGSAAIR
jgi:Zn-dependent protease with chaperone function/uncharacterized RDD family membrane protein YckC